MKGMFYLYLNKFYELRSGFWLWIFVCITNNMLAQSSLNVQLLDNWNDQNLQASSLGKRYNDCWGFVINGQEYAALGSTEGVHFFSISSSGKFELVEFVPGQYQSGAVVHRDIKIYDHYAYLVCDEGISSMQIVDLSYLPDSVHIVKEGITTKAHNIFIDSLSERLYLCGAQHADNIPFALTSLEIYSLSNPENPNLLQFWTDSDIPYVHDVYVRNNIAYLNCGNDGLRVYDFSDPVTPIFIQNLNLYSEQGYNHQGWLSPNGKWYVFADESTGKRIKKCSVENHQVTVENLMGTNSINGSVPHNIMISDQFAFVAYYNEGLRIYQYDESSIKEIAHYDTYPDDGPGTMDGAWGVYSELPSGRILVSDRVYGLFLFDFNREVFSHEFTNDISLFPNPMTVGDNITLFINDAQMGDILEMEIVDASGRKCFSSIVFNQIFISVNPRLEEGIYKVTIRYSNLYGELIESTESLLVIK